MTNSSTPPVNLWREAVLDRLAVLCLDAPQDEPPESILRRIIEAEVAIALDPRVSDAAPPAAPAPAVPNGCEKIFTHKWLDPDCIERGCKSLAAPHGPAECCRNELLTALHSLASNYENALGMFGQDGEGRRKAEGDLAHAMQVAAKHNRNGPGCAAPAVPLTQLWCPETGELCSKCAKTGTCEASMLQAHGIGASK